MVSSDSYECYKDKKYRKRYKYKHKKRCKDNYEVIKAVFPGIIMSGNNIFNLDKIENDEQALAYITPVDPDEDIYNPDSVISFFLNLNETEDVKNIDHIHLDLHVRTESTQDIVFNMFLFQTVNVLTEIDGEEQYVKQAQQYLYQGHKYTLEGRKWSEIQERWDRPRNLGVLRATNLPDDADLVKPVLQIVMYDIQGRLEVDKTIQLHVEYCVENCKRC